MAEKEQNTKKDRKMPAKQHHLLRHLVKGLCWLYINLFYRLDYRGLENVPAQGPVILAANHTHLIDVMLVHCGIKPWVSWVAKKELVEIPLLGWIIKAMGAIPVDRDKADISTARGMIASLRRGDIVGMFPQGTRVPPDKVPLVPPRSGVAHFALKLDVPILPVAIEGSFRIFSKLRIVFGPAYKLNSVPGQKYDSAAIQEKSIYIMQKIYDLLDKKYELALPSERQE